MNAPGLIARTSVAVGVVIASAAVARASSAPLMGGVIAGGAIVMLAFIVESVAARMRLDRLVWGVVGGIAGLVAGTIIGMAAGTVVASALDGMVGAPGTERGVVAPASIVHAVAILVGLHLGVAVGVRRGPDLTGLNALLFRPDGSGRVMKLVDTSAIIDGRIADLAATGFVDGPLVVPQFVLRELQEIADSTDPRRRARGKRGFEVLQRLQGLPGALTEIDEVDVPGVTDVDEKLLEIAKARAAKIITTDYNLNQRAELSGVTVLNINELANALKPTVVAGEPLRVHVVREGKESGQGVAYLDDGTMIVVDQGKRWIGQIVDVAVTSVLQTPAGRIIFTRLREEAPARA